MGGFSTIKEVIDAENNGKCNISSYRKNPTNTSLVGAWVDLSQYSGTPPAKYWFDATPLTAKAIYQSDDGGFYHGPNVSPSEKYIRQITTQFTLNAAAPGSPVTAILCDYLLYYPTIDDSTTDPQLMVNNVTLPRYTNGKGVQMIAVNIATRTGGQTFTVSYTNQDGVPGRTTQPVTQNTAGVATLTNTDRTVLNGAGPFIPLQLGDTGVRSVESVTMNGTDTGLFSIILVKPLLQTTFTEPFSLVTTGNIAATYEKDLLLHNNDMPKIYDNAFLNFLVMQNGETITNLRFMAQLKTIWT
jgi:hypothetical protein